PNYETACLLRAGEWVAAHEEALRTPKPCSVQCSLEGDFVLEGKNNTFYYFVHNLGVIRNQGDHVAVKGGRQGATGATQLYREVARVSWLDNGQELTFTQDPAQGLFNFNATGFPYGTHQVVRVAKIECL
ncbi:MAG: hypothetical protein F6K21_36905, partial [Symploca sp. SIO2D2]|nr:hypothetical protein [Symploca sp. SIO2D2]